MNNCIKNSEVESLSLISRGKVRDMYAIDEARLLMVQTDRISAYDVVMDEAIPDKGYVLTRMSQFWFEQFAQSGVAHHLLDDPLESVLTAEEAAALAGRAQVIRRLKPLPIEAVCRGYLVGSGWSEYEKTQSVCGIPLPAGLSLAAALPEVIFTPATKAEQGEHDENISFQRMVEIVGADIAERVRAATIELYTAAAETAARRGIIIADTKFEFAMAGDELILIDEVLTPDSSRFWDKATWREGVNPDSYDKQFLRDYLSQQSWNKKPPPPTLPDWVIEQTSKRYREIESILLS